ncbi:MAG: YqaA family protein [Alphaproteobacteria bacterium]
MLRRAYDMIMTYASHPRAVWWLNAVAFAESSIFPIPPDPLYIAMVLKNPSSVWKFATFCTISSVIGGLVGYAIGFGLYESVGAWVIGTYGLEESFANFQRQFDTWGFWIIALKGLTPIPYKIVTISCGLASFDLKEFIMASLIARSFRFFTLGGLIWYYGEEIQEYLDRNLTLVTITGLVALIGGFYLFKYVF